MFYQKKWKEFKFYEEYNKLAEKTETEWTNLNGTLIS